MLRLPLRKKLPQRPPRVGPPKNASVFGNFSSACSNLLISVRTRISHVLLVGEEQVLAGEALD